MSPEDSTAGSSPEQAVDKKHRRNGKLPSCETCRVSKLRCDHASPCGRCQRLGKTCIFHPAPMTRQPADAHNSRQRVLKPHATPQSPSKRRRIDSPSPSVDGQPPLVNPLTLIGSIEYHRRSTQYMPGSVGEIGNVSLLLENRVLFDNEGWVDPVNGRLTSLVEDAIRMGAAILAWMPDEETHRDAMNQYLEVTHSATSIAPLLFACRERFWAEYGHFLAAPRSQEKLEALSRQICLNTSRPVPMTTTSQDYIDSLTGKNTRWDVIGIFLTKFSFVVSVFPETVPVSFKLRPNKGMSKMAYAAAAQDCAGACRILSAALDVPKNTLALALQYQLYLCHPGNETSSATWRRLGCLMAALTEAGLHSDAIPDQRSLLCSELQKRIFESSFGVAQLLATFHGRPPPLSRQFVTCSLPLDVTDEDLMTLDYEAAAAKVDHNGWRKDGVISQGTYARAFALSSIIRDELLELSLGRKLDPQTIASRVIDLRQRIDKIYSAIPEPLKHSLTRENIDPQCPARFMVNARLQLRWSLNKFHLERIDSPLRDETRFLEHARSMLTDVNSIWIERDRFPRQHDDIQWLILNYGVLGSLNLAVNLHKHATGGLSTLSSVQRARDIQMLSRFQSCMEWFDVSDVNYGLCNKVSRMLQAILDKVLTAPVTATPPQSMPTPDSLDVFLGKTMIDLPTFGADFEDWLTGEWDTGVASGVPTVGEMGYNY